MAIKINDKEIPESHIPVITDAYSKIYSEFLTRYTAIMEEWKELYPIVFELGIFKPAENQPNIEQNKIDPDHLDKISLNELLNGNSYDENWAWLTKINYILAVIGYPLTANDIMNIIVGHYEKGTPKDKISNSIPATLSAAFANEKIDREKRANGEFAYKPRVIKALANNDDDLPF